MSSRPKGDQDETSKNSGASSKSKGHTTKETTIMEASKSTVRIPRSLAFIRTRNGVAITSLAAVILALSILLTISITNRGQIIPASKEEQATSTTTTRRLSGRTTDEDKADAVATAATLLNAANKHTGDQTADQRVQALEQSGDHSSLADLTTMDALTRYTPEFDEALKTTTRQSLIKASSLLDDNNDGKIEVRGNNPHQYVYLDQQAGVAYVPLQVFSEHAPAFSLEMVYVDGQWRFAPYTLLDAIRLSAALGGAQQH